MSSQKNARVLSTHCLLQPLGCLRVEVRHHQVRALRDSPVEGSCTTRARHALVDHT